MQDIAPNRNDQTLTPVSCYLFYCGEDKGKMTEHTSYYVDILIAAIRPYMSSRCLVNIASCPKNISHIQSPFPPPPHHPPPPEHCVKQLTWYKYIPV